MQGIFVPGVWAAAAAAIAAIAAEHGWIECLRLVLATKANDVGQKLFRTDSLFVAVAEHFLRVVHYKCCIIW